MLVKPLTTSKLSGTGTLNLTSGYNFGGLDLNADGTNAASATIRNSDSGGTVLVDTSSIYGKTIIAPFQAASGTIYYSITGTGATAMLYEWAE